MLKWFKRKKSKDDWVPAYFVPVEWNGLTIYVTPDYFEKEGVRWPVGMTEATKILRNNDCVLPNTSMVLEIWRQADIRLTPIPLPPGPQMTTEEYFRTHDRLINEQLERHGDVGGKLIAGHKKDIVLSSNPSKVAIYGWHQQDGRAIQPYSTVHGYDYRDYSHGLRLVYRYAKDELGNKVDLGGI